MTHVFGNLWDALITSQLRTVETLSHGLGTGVKPSVVCCYEVKVGGGVLAEHLGFHLGDLCDVVGMTI